MVASPMPIPRVGLSIGQLWMVLAVGLPVLGSLIAPMSTVDLAYQVRAGQLMLESGSILTTDPFTFTVWGEPWLNQQWGAGLVLGAGYDAAGWAGLALLRGTLIGVIFGLVLVACLAAGARPRTAALLTIAAFGVSIASLGLRAQLFGMTLFAATLAVLAMRRRHPRLVWVLPLLMVPWASLHGSFPLGLAAIGVALLVDLVEHRATVRSLALALVLSSGATLLNPFGIDAWTYALNLASSSQVTRLVTEWQPTSLRSYTGIAFALSAVSVAGLLLWRGRSAPWPLLAWVAALFLLGLYAERGVAWWALGTAPAMAFVLAGRAADPTAEADLASGEPGVSAPVRRPINLLVAVGLCIAIIAALPVWRGSDPLYGPAGLLLDAPRGVTDALLDRAASDDRLFASQAWGSWLEFAVRGVPVMVDSRFELFDYDVWADYLAVTAGRSDWPVILDRWRVSLIAVDHDSQRNLLRFLADDPGWTLVHTDEAGAVYVRSDRAG